jgi:hypothetical protein
MNTLFLLISTCPNQENKSETDQKSGGLDSKNPDLIVNRDKSVTVWLGPEAPKGKEGNWIQTNTKII